MANEMKDDSDDVLMDHVALECMHAIEMKDKEKFIDALHVLIAHAIQGMNGSEGEDDV